MSKKLLLKLHSLPIGQRNLVGFFSLLGFMTFIAILSLLSLALVSRNITLLYQNAYQVNNYSQTIQNDFTLLEKEMYKLIATNSSNATLQTTAEILSCTESIRMIVKDDSQYSTWLDQIHVQLNTLKNTRDAIVASHLETDTTEALSLIQDNYFKELARGKDAADQLTLLSKERAEAFLAYSLFIRNIVFIVITLLTLFSIYFGLTLSLSITKSITVPLKNFGDILNDFSKGHLTQSIVSYGKDEISLLGQALGDTTSTLQSYITHISNTLSTLAKGDMNIEHTETYEGDFVPIQHSIFHIQEAFNKMLHQIYDATDAITHNTLKLLGEAKGLSEEALRQKEVAQTLYTHIQTLEHKASLNTQSSSHIQTIIAESSLLLEEGHEKMNDTLEAMSSIELATQSIYSLLSTIEAIASQSNLLALNATIEAAHLGTAGKGFSVIAQQMGDLAHKCSLAVKDTHAFLDTCMKASQKGVSTSTHMQASLVSISKHITSSQTVLQSIADTSCAQHTALSSLFTYIEKLNIIAQTLSHSVVASEHSVHLIASQSQQLKAHLDQFQLV